MTQKHLLKEADWDLLSSLLSLFQHMPFPACREAMIVKVLTKWRMLQYCSRPLQEQYLHAVADLLAQEPLVNHKEVLASILARQTEPQKPLNKAFQFKLQQTDGASVSPIKIYRDLATSKALDKQKARIIFECLIDFVPVDKPVEVEIPFLGVFRDFFLRLQNEKGLKLQSIVDVLVAKFHTNVIQLKEPILGMLAEVFKHHHSTVGRHNSGERR